MESSNDGFNPSDGTWLNKRDAALLLGVRIRQVERRAKDGLIAKVTLERKSWEKTSPVVYSRADIEALLRGTPNHHATLVEDGLGKSLAPPASEVKPAAQPKHSRHQEP